MNFDLIFNNATVYLLVFVRCFALMMTLPLFSMRSTPRVAKVALAGFMAFFFTGTGSYDFSAYNLTYGFDQIATLEYLLLLVGEALIGIILGFYVTIIFAAFSTAGQFIAFQMGFGAASAYDALSQVENPLMGQFFNLVAMLVFMQSSWFQTVFLGALGTSFKTINAVSIIAAREDLLRFMLKGLTNLFADALIISLPVMGTLFLITICTGLLTKAAPQMNLLSEGFPIMIMVAFGVLVVVFPDILDFFIRSFHSGFVDLQNLFIKISGGIK